MICEVYLLFLKFWVHQCSQFRHDSLEGRNIPLLVSKPPKRYGGVEVKVWKNLHRQSHGCSTNCTSSLEEMNIQTVIKIGIILK